MTYVSICVCLSFLQLFLLYIPATRETMRYYVGKRVAINCFVVFFFFLYNVYTKVQQNTFQTALLRIKQWRKSTTIILPKILKRTP